MIIRLMLLFVLASFTMCGCSQAPIQIKKYTPKNAKVKISTPFLHEFSLYQIYDAHDYNIQANIYEYNNIIAVMIEITNKSAKNLEAEEYTIDLTDGRDFKPIRMLKRQDLINIRAKFTSGTKGAIQDQVIEATMNNAMKVANVNTKEKLVSLLNLAIDNYFSFRTIYAKETRQGLLGFMPDFKLEYPLTIFIKLPEKEVAFQFLLEPEE